MAEWYYIGHYGQLGPLTREQIDELIEGGVISRETYVWRGGLSEWVLADRVPELASSFQRANPYTAPPPPPSPTAASRSIPPTAAFPSVTDPAPPQSLASQSYYRYPEIKSDKSRTLGGILQLLIPGAGRLYLGYSAIAVLQFILSLCGVGVVWAWIDAVVILAGGVRMDGYGRQLND